MNIPYVNLGIKNLPAKSEILNAVENVFGSGRFILGENVRKFEEAFAGLCQTPFAVGVANGTDALLLAMKALGIGEGDEVITAPNSFLASASSIALAGAKPVFADVRDDFNIDPEKIEKAITPATKAIMPVHLTGRPADMDPIMKIAGEYGLYVLEDSAQAVRAEYKGKRTGSFGIAGCFSMHPLKNLSACGDAGMITTHDEELYEKILVLRNHGLKNRDECKVWSCNSRLDALQAAILNVKIKYLGEDEKRKREIASIYQSKLKNAVKTPTDKPHEKAVYHTFIIQTEHRNGLQDYLARNGIETKVHYPIPIHLQEAASYLGYKKGDFPIAESHAGRILSLPIFPQLTNEEVDYICNTVLDFYKRRSVQKIR